MVEVRDEAWYVDQVEWAVADNLVGDRKVATAGVLRLWRFHGVPDPEFNAPCGFLREIRRLLEAARRPSHGSQEYTPIPSSWRCLPYS